jgi:hypothetical protein
MLVLAIALAACGGGGGESSVATHSQRPAAKPRPHIPRDQNLTANCPRIYRRATALIREVAPAALGNLDRDQVRSLNFSGCALGSRGATPRVNVHVTLDTAPEVLRRYDNRITESQQFSSRDKKLFPMPVGGVGDLQVGGGGANWLATFNQLLSVRGQHLLAIDFFVRGVPLEERKRLAKRLALTIWGLLGVPRHASIRG